MRRSRIVPVTIVLVGVCFAGCDGGCAQDSGTASTTPTAAPSATTKSPELRSLPPMSEPIPSAPLYSAGDIDTGLKPFIDQAAADLATRLGVPAADITTHAAVLVVWPDASVGCPQPNMRYAQVATDGSIIELAHDATFYRYHSGGGRGPFLCQMPLTSPPPAEGGS